MDEEHRDGLPCAGRLPDGAAAGVNADTGTTNSLGVVDGADVVVVAAAVGEGDDDVDAIPPDQRCCKCVRDRDRWTCNCAPDGSNTGRNTWMTCRPRWDRDDRCGKRKKPCVE